MSQGLFRKEALARFMRIDSPGAILTIVPASTTTLFATMSALAVALVAFAALGQTQIVAEGRGVVRPEKPPIVLRAPIAGTVLAVPKGRGDRVGPGAVLARLDTHVEADAVTKCTSAMAVERHELAALEQRLAEWDHANAKSDATVALVVVSQLRSQREKVTALVARCDALATVVAKSELRAPVDATVSDLAVSEGALVQEGDVIATVEPSPSRLVAYLVVPEAQRGELAPGQPVRLKLDALPSEDVGAATGHVTRLLDALPSHVKLEAHGTEPSAGGVVLEIAVDTVPSGAELRSGMTFTGNVATRRVRVAKLLFGGASGD